MTGADFCPINTGNEWKYSYKSTVGCISYLTDYIRYDSVVRTISIVNVKTTQDTINSLYQ